MATTVEVDEVPDSDNLGASYLVVLRGKDSYGSWVMTTVAPSLAMEGHRLPTCAFCDQEVYCVLHYWNPRFPQDLRPGHTILKKAQARIGVDCGCYAKLHRQVVHIVESGLKKGIPV